jgi:hypothetical protein
LRTSHSIEAGAHASYAKADRVPRKGASATPMIVNGRRFSCTTRPTTEGSDAKRRRHNRSLITSTASPPGRRSSPGRKLRPRRGRTPSTSKKFAETISVFTHSVSRSTASEASAMLPSVAPEKTPSVAKPSRSSRETLPPP